MSAKYEVVDNNFTVFLKDNETNKNIVSIYELTETLNNYDTELKEHKQLIDLLCEFITSKGYDIDLLNDYLIDKWHKEKEEVDKANPQNRIRKYEVDPNGVYDTETDRVYYTDVFSDLLEIIRLMNYYYETNKTLQDNHSKEYKKILKENKELEEKNKRLMSYFKDIVYKIERDNNHSYINVSIASNDYKEFEELLTEKKWELGLL